MVSFIDNMAKIVPNKDAVIEVYGSNSHSRDVMMAMKKLDRERYENISFL